MSIKRVTKTFITRVKQFCYLYVEFNDTQFFPINKITNQNNGRIHSIKHDFHQGNR